jgi:serine/threonine protein kinase
MSINNIDIVTIDIGDAIPNLSTDDIVNVVIFNKFGDVFSDDGKANGGVPMYSINTYIRPKIPVGKVLGEGSFGQVIASGDHVLKQFRAKRMYELERDNVKSVIELLNKTNSTFVDKYTLLMNTSSDVFDDVNLSIKYKNCFGPTVHEYLAKSKKFTLNIKVPVYKELFFKTARALLVVNHVMNNRGWCHCDIKPQNLMVCENGYGQMNVRVIDFGLSMFSKCDGESELYTRKFWQSLNYMEELEHGLLQRFDEKFMSELWKTIKQSSDISNRICGNDMFAIGLTLAMIYTDGMGDLITADATRNGTDPRRPLIIWTDR